MSDIIATIFGGGGTGILGGFLTAVMGYFTKRSDQKHELALMDKEKEIIHAEAEVAIKINSAKVKGEIEVAEMSAFQASIESDKPLIKKSWIDKMIESGNWFLRILAGFVIFLLGTAEFFKGLARPAITYYLFAVMSFITYWAYDLAMRINPNMAQDIAIDIFKDCVLAIIYMTLTAGGWYFGDRATKRAIQRFTGQEEN